MRRTLVIVVVAGGFGWGSPCFAQTTLTASASVVAPGSTVTLRVAGPPGHHFAIAGSTVGSGMTFGGVGLPIGADVQVITMGLLDGTGTASVGFIPPFSGSTIDRFYLVAVTSSAPSFIPPSASAGLVLRNADATWGAAGGDLAGNYPNPAIAPTAGTNILTALNAGSGTISDARLSTNVATKSYVDAAVGGAVGVGATAGGDLAGTYPNPTIAPTAGTTILTALNASTGTISDARLSTAIATKSYVDTAVAGAVSVGATAGGDLAGTFPNPTIASTAGSTIVAAINAGAGIIDAGRLPGSLATTTYVDTGDAARVAFAPAATQSITSANPLIRVQQTGSGDLLSLSVNSSTVPSGGTINQEQFRFMSDGGFVARSAGSGVIPSSGPGTRLSWHPAKSAFRAGNVTGTQWDDVNTGPNSFAGGANTTASGTGSFAWGINSVSSGSHSDAFGLSNAATGDGSVVIGGSGTASGGYSVAIGWNTVSSGLSSAAIGYENAACGQFSVALGRYAVTASANPTLPSAGVGGDACNGTPHDGAFVFADSSSGAFFRSTAEDQFNVRAAGGARIFTNSALTTGVTLAAGGGAWASVSDRNGRTSFRDLDGETVLAKVVRIPIQEWSYKGFEEVRHVGPIAQDFYAAFGLGPDPLRITTIDPSGIALRAIQALEARTRALQQENADLRAELDAIKVLLRRLQPQ